MKFLHYNKLDIRIYLIEYLKLTTQYLIEQNVPH